MKSSEDSQRLVKDLDKYLDQAQGRYQQGNLAEAKDFSLLAAQRLEELLRVSPPELVEPRAQALEDILDFAEHIQDEMEQPQSAGQRTGPEKAEKTTVDRLEAESSRPSFAVEQKPSLKLRDIAGMEALKDLIRAKLILPWKAPETARKYGVQRGAGILLYGPPGVGKSMIARGIAGEFDASLISVKASDILDCLYGNTEKNISALFAQARELGNAVVFIDELDGLGSDRDGSDSHMRRFVNQLLVELQGFNSSLDQVIVLGATNKPWLLDRALIRAGRLDEMFYIPLPDESTRREIWRLNLEKRLRDEAIDLEELAMASEGLSGADIARICSRASLEACRQAVESGKDVPLTQQSLMRFFPPNPAELHSQELRQMEDFACMYDRNCESFGQMPSPRVRQPLSPSRPEDVHSFWRGVLMGLPIEANVLEKALEISQKRNFSEMAHLLAFALEKAGEALEGQITQLNAADFDHAASRMQPQTLPPGAFLPSEARASISAEEFSSASDLRISVPSKGSEDNFTVVIQEGTVLNPVCPNGQMNNNRPARHPGAADSAQAELLPQLLKQGQDMIDECGLSLSPFHRQKAFDELYRLAQEAQNAEEFPISKFYQYLMQLQEASSTDGLLETASEQIAPPVPASPRITEADRLQALRLINERRKDLGEEWKGFADEVQNATELNLEDFQRRVALLAEEKVRQRLKERFLGLFQERKAYLEAGQIQEIEKALQALDPDYAAMEKSIQDKSYFQHVQNIVEQAIQPLGYDAARSRKLVRKAIRKITRQWMQPTLESTHNMLLLLDRRMRELERYNEQQKKKVYSAAALLEDVEQMVIPPGLIDFSDVAGMDHVKNKLEDAMDMVLDQKKRDMYRRVTGKTPLALAILLYGAPGVGKTFIAKAAAGEFAEKHGFTVMHVPYDAIRGLHYTRKLTRIRQIFETAQKHSPTLVIWDEFDEIASPPRFSGRKYDGDVVATLKQEFEGAVHSDKLMLHLATSNHPWKVDDALLRHGRIGCHVHVLPPDFEARRELFEIWLEIAACDPRFDYQLMAEQCANMTVAEMRRLFDDVSDRVVKEALRHNPDRRITTTDFVAVMDAHRAVHFGVWLNQAAEALAGKYSGQKDLFPDLVRDIEVFQSALHQQKASAA